MTEQDIKDYFKYLGLQSQMTADGLDAHVANCLRRGMQSLWYARPWTFTQQDYSLTISSTAETTDLPDSCHGVITVREKASLDGKDLVYYPKQEFDRLVPKPGAFSADYPQAYTVYWDAATKKSKFACFPYSTATPLYMRIVTKFSGQIADIPDRAHDALIACISYLMYPLGTAERLNAQQEKFRELQKLEQEDSPYRGGIVHIFDDADQQIERGLVWI